MKQRILSILLMSASLSSFANTSDDIRLVVSTDSYAQKEQSGSASNENTQQHNVCIEDDKGNESWCVALKHASRNETNSYQGEKPLRQRFYQVVNVDGHGHSPEQVRMLFEKSGHFQTVELDVVVTQFDVPVNDPYFNYQESYFGSSVEYNNGSHVIEAWADEGEAQGPSDIIVLDSSFFDNADIVYASGRSMVTVGDQVRNNTYLPLDESLEFCTGHGLGVAAVIGAIHNNEIGLAGVMPESRVHVARIMDCGLGVLSDIAAALRYFAGESFDGVDPYQGEPGIINMSLGADVGHCPIFMQDAVDVALEAGFTIVAAAGNHSKDAMNSTPGNCEGVITVAAIDETGELGDFSNFGETIDVVAEGDFVLTMCQEDDVACFFQGTSFSAPLVAGALGFVKQQTNAEHDTLKLALELTANTQTLGETCADAHCGAGLLNMKGMLDFVRAIGNEETNFIRYTLARADTCEHTWAVDYFGVAGALCGLFDIAIMGDYQIQNGFYRLVSFDKEMEWMSENETLVAELTSGKAQLRDVDADNKDYAFQICPNGVCRESYIALDASAATQSSKPKSCP